MKTFEFPVIDIVALASTDRQVTQSWNSTAVSISANTANQTNSI